MRKSIEALLANKDLTTTEISKKSGIPWSTVADLRKGNSSLDRMTLRNAEKLYQVALAIEKGES